MLKGNNDNKFDFLCVTMVDPGIGTLDIKKITTSISVDKKGVTNVVFDTLE